MVGTLHGRFSASTLDRLSDQLESRRAAITRCLDSLHRELTDAAEHRDCSDLLDESSVDDADVRTDQLLIAQARRALAAADAALERIAQGTYGTCSTCRRPIPLVRLRALPDTEICITCSRAIRKHAPEHEDWDDGWTALG